MVRRKPISIADRLGRLSRLMTPNVPDTLGAVSLQSDLMKQIDAYSAEAAKQALAKYNAESFKPVVVQQPDATFVAPVETADKQPRRSKRYVINHSGTPVKSYTNKQREFVNDIYNSYYRNLVASGSSPTDAKRQARHLAQKSAYETGWGQSIYAKHNYGGHEVPDGKGGIRKLTFKSMDDYTKADIKLLDRKWKPWRTAKNEDEFVTAITTDYGQGRYNAVNSKYRNTYKGMSRRMNSYLSTRCGGRIERPKAWVGAVIGAASSLFGSILNSDAQRKQWEEQKRIQEHKDAVTRAENITEALNLTQNAQREYEDRFRLPYAKGGRRRLRDGVSITDGGYAIPIGQNTFLLRGGSHNDINETGQTGIGINIGGKEIEAEGGEVVQKTPKEIRVFSDTITLPNGLTPAEAVEYGANKNNVFKIQQSMNGDYGRRTMRNGGRSSRPVGRNNAVAEGTLQYVNGMWQKRVNYPNSDDGYWQLINADEAARLRNSGWTVLGTPSTNRNITARNSAIRTTSNARNNNTANSTSDNTIFDTPWGWGLEGTPDIIYDAGLGDTTFARQQNAAWKKIYNKDLYYAPESIVPKTEDNNRNNTQRVVSQNSTTSENSAARNNTTRSNRNVFVNSSATKASTPARGSSNRRSLRNRGNNSTNVSKVPTSISEVPTTEQLLSVIPQNAAITTPSYTNPTEQVLRDMQEASRPKETSAITTPTINSEEDYFNYYNDNLNYNQNSVGDRQLKQQGTNTKTPVVENTEINTEIKSTPFQRYTTGDWIGLGADVIGSLGSALINYNAASNIAEPPAPVRLMPGKLITNYNIAPRLSQVSMLRNRGLRDTDELVSSSARLNARNRVNTLANLQADQLWGEKTNREVELLNADTMNQQSVNNQNIQAYNAWQDRLAELRNRRSLGQAQALQFGLSGLSDAVGNFLDQGRQNYADNQAMRYYAALLGDEGREWLRRNGVNFRNGGRMRLRNR